MWFEYARWILDTLSDNLTFQTLTNGSQSSLSFLFVSLLQYILFMRTRRNFHVKHYFNCLCKRAYNNKIYYREEMMMMRCLPNS